MENPSQMGCCIFLRWPSTGRLSYKQLTHGETEDQTAVKVIVGKEKREFLVDPFVLDKYPFRVLLETVRNERKGSEGFERKGGELFVDVDEILFEHILWLVCNESAFSMVQLNLREIIEFYAQDN